MTTHACRGCGAALSDTVADLGVSPLANAYLSEDDLDRPEAFYPLHAYVCRACWLVQLPAHETPEAIFGEYAYFSSYADTWVEHARRYVDEAVVRYGLGPTSHVVELASNDGYLLRWFVAQGIPALGIEPARNVAAVAIEAGVPTIAEFFGVALAERLRAEGRAADLIVANNVLAHVPDLHDFVGGIATLLRENGRATIEFPHVLNLLAQAQFDTIYHEHFSYFSLIALEPVFARHGLTMIDVAELPTHGGSLRLTVAPRGTPSPAVVAMLARERAAGLDSIEVYAAFGETVARVKRDLLRFLIDARERGERVVAYGAPAKGNTLLNYAGVGPDLLAYTVDRNPYKQGRRLPGSRIPIRAPEALLADRPDTVLVLPWNIFDEVSGQMDAIRSWGGRFATAVPRLEVR